jgi:hypothetical protein
MVMEFVIWHDGSNWVAENDVLTVASPSLEGLDAEMRQTLIRREMLKEGERARVFMAFDNSTIPGWMRPYAQHYFNRVVELEG